MNEHPSYLVYRHLPLFFESRGLRLPEAESVADRSKFTDLLDHFGYHRCDVKDQKDRTTVVVILAMRSEYTEHGPKLKTLIAGISMEDFARKGDLHEVIIIAPEPVLGKKNITDIIVGFRKDETPSRARYYNMYPYSTFSLDIPNVQCIPRHTIAPQSEVGEFLKRERLLVTDLNKMLATNPPVVWIGARPGQVIRVEMGSETAGEAVAYYLVK